MKLSWGLTADAANVAIGHKINVLGTFHHIAAPAVPLTHPTFALAMEFVLGPEDKDKSFAVSVSLLDPDGRILSTFNAPLHAPPVDTPEIYVPLVMTINNQIFPKFGPYRLDIKIDGESLENRIAFEVSPMRMGPGMQAPEGMGTEV